MPVVVSIVILLLSAGLIVAVALMRQRFIVMLLGVIAGVLAGALLFTGPKIAASPQFDESALINTTEGKFKDFYHDHSAILGKPIGACGVQNDDPKVWAFSCPHVFAQVVAHPQQAAPWNLQLRNLGDELRRRRSVPEESSPDVPQVVAGFLSSEGKSGRDPLYWYGFPLTSPHQVGDRWEQYWSKTVLEWDSDDPSSVKRQPVGLLLWTLEHGGDDPQEDWTSLRRQLLLASTALLLVAGLPLVLSSGGGWTRGEFAGF